MNTVYLRFLAKNVLKKWSFWIIGFLYILFTAIFVLMVPAILKTTPFVIWSNTMMSPQIMLMYAGALLSAVLSIAIFRDYRDNGTELIVVSKPINRQKIIFSKLLIFLIASVGFALVSCLVCIFTLGFKEVSGYQTFSLMTSVFIANAIFCLIFGFIATVVSLFLNKIWTILLNIVFVVLMVIFHMVSQFTIKTPATLASDDDRAVTSIQYLNQNGEPHSAAVITPNINIVSSNPIDITSVDQERDVWNSYRHRSHVGGANYFDFVSQFQLINNEFGLQDYMNGQSDNSFGSNRWYDYTIDQPIVSSTFSNPDTVPLYYVQASSFEPSTDWLANTFNLITNQDVIMLGKSSTAGALIPTGSIQNSRGFFVANGHPGNLVSRNNGINYSWNDLQPTTERQSFDEMYEQLINSSTIYKSIPSPFFTVGKKFNMPALEEGSSKWSGMGTNVNNVYDYIHYQLINKLNGTLTTIKNLDDLMVESLKFRLYLFDTVNRDLYQNYYDDCVGQFQIPIPPINSISLQGSPLWPSTDTDPTHLGNISNWNANASSYFISSDTWKKRALLDFAIEPQTIGYSSIVPSNYDRDYSHSSSLLTTSVNFALGYESLMASFTSTPTFHAWAIALEWLAATTIIGIVATIIYWKTDFK